MFTLWATPFSNDIDVIPEAFANKVRIDLSRAIDGTGGGGPYTPGLQIEIAGAGLKVSANFLVTAVDATFDTNVEFLGGVTFNDTVSFTDVTAMDVHGPVVLHDDASLTIDPSCPVIREGTFTKPLACSPVSVPVAAFNTDGIGGMLCLTNTVTGLWYPIDLPVRGCTITGYGVHTSPVAHGSMPTTRQKVEIRRINIQTGVTTTMESYTDPLTTTGPYSAAHVLAKNNSALAFDDSYNHFLVYLAEDGGAGEDNVGLVVTAPWVEYVDGEL